LTPLYHDKDILVLSKPSGLLSVPGKPEDHADCLESRAKTRFPTAGIVHRLDLGTSGIMVMALNAESHRKLSRQFEKRAVLKTYIARVWGPIKENTGMIDLPLRCDWPNRPRQMVDHEQGRPSITHWEVLEREQNATRVRLKPETGRSHQLRVHMLALGHPILGDEFYAHNEAYKASSRLLLHAQDLQFYHPTTNEQLTFTAPCPF